MTPEEKRFLKQFVRQCTEICESAEWDSSYNDKALELLNGKFRGLDGVLDNIEGIDLIQGRPFLVK